MAKYYRRQRIVAQQIIGRPLSCDEQVHHIDGNTKNNDPSNLQVMSNLEHQRLHKTGKLLTQGHKDKISRSLSGVSKSSEHAKKVGEANRGKVISTDQRIKLRLANLGKKLSEETKRKMSVSRLAYLARRP
jgi:hypothetical protein